MDVNSLEFFGFLALCLLLAVLIARKRPIAFFVIVSICFYAISDLKHLPFMVGLVGVNYLLASRLQSAESEYRKNLLFWIAITVDGGVLFLSKLMTSPYSATLFGEHRSVLHAYGLAAAPLGISYVVFQLISCVTDLYSGRVQGRISPGQFTAFSLFFPQVTAGPLSRVHNLLPQLQQPWKFTGTNFVTGFHLILYGLFKKLVIANNMDPIITTFFKHPEAHLPHRLLIAVILNPIQLYADFSAYTDIARGAASILGISLPCNFNRPYTAVSVTEFWRRWHMSLSDWLRDYVYTPLALRFRAFGYTAICGSLVATFVICGVWHGFTFPYAVFGFFQGTLLSFEVLTRKNRTRLSKSMNLRLFRCLGWVYTMLMFAIAEVFFRSQTMTQSWSVLSAIACWRPPLAPAFVQLNQRLLVIAISVCFWAALRYGQRFSFQRRYLLESLLIPCAIVVLGRTSDQPFIYAQF